MLRLQSVCSNPLVCSNITRSTVKTRPFRLVRSTPFRGFSAAMAPQQEWLVLLPDVEGMLEKRKEIRPTHLNNVAPEVKSGKVLLGGALLSKPIKEGEAPDMTGSALLTVGETKEDVLEFLKNDIYAKIGVWDMSKVQIIPFRTAVRKGLPDLGTEA